MSSYPDDRLYSKSHEWIRVDGRRSPPSASPTTPRRSSETSSSSSCRTLGEIFDEGQEFGTIESVKAVSELFLPVAGEIVEVNKALVDEPNAVNEDPHGDGWLVKVKVTSDGALDGLMNAAAYEKFVEEEAKA